MPIRIGVNMRSVINFIALAVLIIVPTHILLTEYTNTGKIPWNVAIIWFLILLFGYTSTYSAMAKK